jgi:predicted RNA-binding protein
MELQMFENAYNMAIAGVRSIPYDQKNSKELIDNKWEEVILGCNAVLDYLGPDGGSEKTKWEQRIIEAQKHKISDHKQKAEPWYSIYNILKGEEGRMDELYRTTLKIFDSHRFSVSKSYPKRWNQGMKQCASGCQDMVDKLQTISEQDNETSELMDKWRGRKDYALSEIVQC